MATKIITPEQQGLGAKVPVTSEDVFDKRKAEFIKDVDASGDKYQIGIAPELAYTNKGVLPVINFIDRKAQPKPPKAPQQPDNADTKQK